MRRSKSRMKASERFEKKTVAGHCKISTRRNHHVCEESSEQGNNDDSGKYKTAGCAEHCLTGLSNKCLIARDARDRHQKHKYAARQNIKDRNYQNTDDQRPGNVSFWVFDLAGDTCNFPPACECKKRTHD